MCFSFVLARARGEDLIGLFLDCGERRLEFGIEVGIWDGSVLLLLFGIMKNKR
jgi:hypothetical protein